jgi:phosphate transport system substrate-binding protein
MKATVVIPRLILASALVWSCGCKASPKPAQTRSPGGQVSGRITIDGSSTVYPITDLVAREFRSRQPRVGVRVDLSGSGRGLKRLCQGEIDIAGASRPIEPKEIAQARERNIDVIELPVAFDGLTVVTSRETTWADELTTAELKAIWAPGSAVQKWRDIRPGWPAQPLLAAGSTPEDGTFDYFTKAICGKEKAIRADYFSHADEHVLAPYVADHPGSLGFFGYAWYLKYKDRLKAIAVHESGLPPVMPSPETVRNGQYRPLSRPLFVYVNAASARRHEVAAFVDFYLAGAGRFAERAGYIPLPPEVYGLAQQRFATGKTGSVFNGIEVNMPMEKLLAPETR